MKIYEERIAPNARRVRMFMAEKGCLDDVEWVQLDLKSGENITPEFKRKNPLAKVPVLELDDGTCVSESVAICRYFEALHPESSLMGEEPLEQAQIEMWQRRCEIYFMNLVGMGFQHTSGYFADRMTPVKEWGEICVKSAAKFLKLLEARLAESEFVAGEKFSIADITALVTIDFAKVIRLRLDDSMPNINRWYAQMNERPSAQA
ncbi:MAG: glutathione S-transferase [Oleiphilus sp.]|nr:MAG: glutathione S-transferase [Oleiphilus sp.]